MGQRYHFCPTVSKKIAVKATSLRPTFQAAYANPAQDQQHRVEKWPLHKPWSLAIIIPQKVTTVAGQRYPRAVMELKDSKGFMYAYG